jgi:hypothetical protein
MIERPNKVGEAAANIGIVLLLLIIVAVIIFGIISFTHWIFSLFAYAHMPHVGVPDWLPDLFTETNQKGVKLLSAERIGVLGTALFTATLVYVTATMGRASRRQVAGDGPLLRVNLILDPVTTAEERPITIPLKRESRDLRKREVYQPALVEDDERVFNGANFKSLTPSRMLTVQIDNVQTRPFAVARDIKVTVRLSYQVTVRDAFAVGHASAASGTPSVETITLTRYLDREIQVRILPPNSAVSEPIFNLAALNDCEVSVRDVTYCELRRRKPRKAAYGDLFLTLKEDGTIECKEGYSRPEGWEMP